MINPNERPELVKVCLPLVSVAGVPEDVCRVPGGEDKSRAYERIQNLTANIRDFPEGCDARKGCVPQGEYVRRIETPNLFDKIGRDTDISFFLTRSAIRETFYSIGQVALAQWNANLLQRLPQKPT